VEQVPEQPHGLGEMAGQELGFGTADPQPEREIVAALPGIRADERHACAKYRHADSLAVDAFAFRPAAGSAPRSGPVRRDPK